MVIYFKKVPDVLHTSHISDYVTVFEISIYLAELTHVSHVRFGTAIVDNVFLFPFSRYVNITPLTKHIILYKTFWMETVTM